MSDLPTLLDVDELSRELGLSARTIQLRQQAGCLPGFVKVFGRHPRWRRDVILEWIEAGCPPVEAQAGAIELAHLDDLTTEADDGTSDT